MHRFMILALALSSPALADDNEPDRVEINAGVSAGFPGINMNIQVSEGSPHAPAPRAVARQEQAGDGYRVAWESDRDGGTWFKVLAPEGAHLTVVEDGSKRTMASGTIPVSFQARGNTFYSVMVHLPGGTFTRKLEARSGRIAQVWLSPHLQPPPAVVVVSHPPPHHHPAPPAGPARACGPDFDLEAVLEALEDEDFSDGKLRVLGDAAQARGFCVNHVVRLLGVFDFETDKLKALKVLAPRITDRQNKFKVYSAFEFDSSRDEARSILR